MAEKLYTVAQAAEYLQCSLSTIRRRIREGHLTAIKNGRLVRIRESELGKMLTDGNSPGNEQPVKEDADTDTT